MAVGPGGPRARRNSEPFLRDEPTFGQPERGADPLRRDIIRTAMGFALAGVASSAHAQFGGGRPLRIIVPLSVGATGDIVARKMMPALQKQLGQTAYVDNIPGAGSVIGIGEMVRAPKDGNTICIVSSNYVDDPGIFKKMPFDTLKDITTVGVIGDSPQVLVVNPSVPAHNLKELIALAKAKPGGMHYGSGGIGTTIHLQAVQLAKQAGINIVHVPFKGNTPMLSALLGGQVQMAFNSTTQMAPYIKTGKLRAIGIASKNRSHLLPDIPTLAEQGLTGYDLAIWMAVLAPAGLQPAVANKLNHAVNAALQQPDVANWFHSEDFRLDNMTLAQAKAFVEAEQAKHLKLVKDAGVPQV